MKVVDDDDREVAQGEVGEIVIRGHNVMKGYWNRPDATAETIRDGWFHSGDMATVDEDGYFFIVDRKKDMIIRGGYNVYPREIEEVLYEHPGGPRGGRARDARRRVRRGGRRRGRAQGRRRGQRRRAARVRQGARWPPTSTRVGSGSSTTSRRVRRARSSSARSPCPTGTERHSPCPSRSEWRRSDPASGRDRRRRRAAPRDDRRARDLRALGRCRSPAPWNSSPARCSAPHPSAEAMIAEVGEVTAGFALFYTSFSTWECLPGIWLEDLFVRPEHRRAGVGALLLARARSADGRAGLHATGVERARLERARARVLREARRDRGYRSGTCTGCTGTRCGRVADK